jgi:MoaA/NifB/PqqE/SkfB family radical SAM enzyme
VLTKTRFEALLAAGLSHLQWSFHSHDHETFDRVFGAKVFETAVENLKGCLAVAPDRISFNFVRVNANRTHFAETEAFLKSLGARHRLRMIPAFSRAGALELASIAPPASLRGGRDCLYAKKSIFIGHNGSVSPCSSDMRRREKIADILKESPASVLATWRRKSLGAAQDYEICKRCESFFGQQNS